LTTTVWFSLTARYYCFSRQVLYSYTILRRVLAYF